MSDGDTHDDQTDDTSTASALDVESLEPLSLDDALSLVGEPTRANIIRALGDARDSDRVTPPRLTFSELHDRVDVTDSGRFNYHLGKLVGTFVRKTDEGYVLALPGQLVYESIVAGTLTDRPTVDPFEVGTCPNCSGGLRAGYRSDNLLVVECAACETLFDAIHFPARGLTDRDGDDLLDAAYRYRHGRVTTMRSGVCPGCGGRVERSVRTTVPADLRDRCVCDALAVLSCSACGRTVAGNPSNVALTAPQVGQFFADHDLDAARSRWWRDPVASARESVEPTDGAGSVITRFDCDGSFLRIVLDDDLQLVTARREDS